MPVLETCFITGMVVPSGVATSVATVLALEGTLELPSVLLAALAGGALGDSLGFWIGRATGERVLTGNGRFARTVARRNERMSRFFGRHPLYSVTVARLVSFVRTVMPMAAGMSRLSYSRFLVFEVVGLAGWLVIYVGIGFAAQESWHVATQVVGLGGGLAFAVAGLVLWWALRRRGRRRSAAEEAPC